MDSFTEKLLEKTRTRRENLKNYALPTPSQTNIDSPRRSPLCEVLTNADRKSVSPKSSEKRKISIDKENETVDEECEPTAPKLNGRKARLAALASEINNWEDDLANSKIIQDLVEKPRVIPPTAKTPTRVVKPPNVSVGAQPHTKKEITKAASVVKAEGFKWDDQVINSLQAQGFTPSKSSAHLVYQFRPNKGLGAIKDELNSNISKPKSSTPVDASQITRDRLGMTVDRIAPRTDKGILAVQANKVNEVVKKFEDIESNTKPTRDPAELSVAERRALFEKGLFKSVISKSPIKKVEVREVTPAASREHKVLNESAPSESGQSDSKVNSCYDSEESSYSCPDTDSGQSKSTNDVLDFTGDNEKVPPPPPLPPSTSQTSLQWSPRFKPGCLYPDLDDVESVEGAESPQEESSEEEESHSSILNGFEFAKSDSFEDNELDGLLDEAINEITPKDRNLEVTPKAIYRTPKVPTPSDNEVNEDFVLDNGHEVPLVHTVSFYRKQKPEDIQYTPVRIIRKRPVEVQAPPTSDPTLEIQEKLSHYQEEVQAQRTIIAQTTQAVNLCRQTKEFSGSKEQVEAERVLLVANEKLKSLSNEIQRLKCELAMPRVPPPQGTTTVSISSIRLALKQEFLAHVAQNEDEAVHYFICLLKYRQQVIPTLMVSTEEHISQGCLSFPNLINIHDLIEGFEILVEVYALQTFRETIDHDQKYHIKKEPSRMKLTPMKSILKKPGTPMSTPEVSSRSSSFGQVGFLKITRASLNNKTWILDRVPAFSPLEGKVAMTLNSHTEVKVEERGFLTLFEEVSGFGAWHRRWFVLQQGVLTYWMYPEDENRKPPMGQMHLILCKNKEVGLVRRDVCARPHTIMLHIVRAPEKTDRNSMVATCYKDRTELRYLLSADTKEERILWCNAINSSLNNLRPSCV